MGLKLSALLFLVLVSGTVATVSHELDWLTNPAIRAPGTSGDVAPENWDRLRAEAQRVNPVASVTYLTAPQGPGFAAEVHVQTPEGQRRWAWLHPETGELQGHTSYLNVQRFLLSLHYNLFLPEIGLYLVSGTSLLLVGSLVTGLIVYRRFWQGWLDRPLKGKGSRIWWGDLHKLLGLWSIPFVVVIGLTGVWYLVEAVMFDTGVPVTEVQRMPLSAERVQEIGPAPSCCPWRSW